MGYVDAEVIAESQSRYQVDIVGPIMPDTSWASKEAGRFDHSRFLIDWQAKQVVCILRPDEASYNAIQQARSRQATPGFRSRYAKRAGVEGTVAQAVRTCEMRQARYIGRKKLRLQAFVTAAALNVLRACNWLVEGTHASPPVSRFARLRALAKETAAA